MKVPGKHGHLILFAQATATVFNRNPQHAVASGFDVEIQPFFGGDATVQNAATVGFWPCWRVLDAAWFEGT